MIRAVLTPRRRELRTSFFICVLDKRQSERDWTYIVDE